MKAVYRYQYAAPGRNAGSLLTQWFVFPKGKRYFFAMDKIDSVNDSDAMFLRIDMPGSLRHERGDTFSEIYLSYLGGPEGLRSRPSDFYDAFPPTRSSTTGATRTPRRRISSAPITCATRRRASKALGWRASRSNPPWSMRGGATNGPES